MTKERKLGDKVKAARVADKLRQVDLARLAKASQPYLAQIENSQRVNINLAVLKRLATRVKVSLADLVE